MNQRFVRASTCKIYTAPEKYQNRIIKPTRKFLTRRRALPEDHSHQVSRYKAAWGVGKLQYRTKQQSQDIENTIFA